MNFMGVLVLATWLLIIIVNFVESRPSPQFPFTIRPHKIKHYYKHKVRTIGQKRKKSEKLLKTVLYWKFDKRRSQNWRRRILWQRALFWWRRFYTFPRPSILALNNISHWNRKKYFKDRQQGNGAKPKCVA